MIENNAHRLRGLVWLPGAILWVTLAGGCAYQPTGGALAVDHYIRGQMLLDQGDVQAALEELSRAVASDPGLSAAHSSMGDIYRQQGSFEMASKSYEAAIQANPYAFRTHYNLGLIYQMLAEQSDLAAKIREYLQKAVAVYNKALDLQPKDFDSHLNVAACYFQLGKPQEARQHSQQAVQLDPKSVKARTNLAVVCDSQGDLYEAINAYKAALELRPNEPDLLMKLGQAYIKQGRLKPAMSTFEYATKVAPLESWPWEKLGECLYYGGDHDGSLEAYRKAIEINENSCVGYRGLGVVYMTQFVKDNQRQELREKGLEAWNTSLEIDPKQDDLRKLVQKYTPQLNRSPL